MSLFMKGRIEHAKWSIDRIGGSYLFQSKKVSVAELIKRHSLRPLQLQREIDRVQVELPHLGMVRLKLGFEWFGSRDLWFVNPDDEDREVPAVDLRTGYIIFWDNCRPDRIDATWGQLEAEVEALRVILAIQRRHVDCFNGSLGMLIPKLLAKRLKGKPNHKFPTSTNGLAYYVENDFSLYS